MSKHNMKWSACIAALREKYSLTYRDVEKLCDGNIASSTVYGWEADGKTPKYETAIKFFHWMHKTKKVFTLQEVAECFEVLGFEMPHEWLVNDMDAAEIVHLALRGTDKLTDEGKEQVVDFVRRMQEKYGKKTED
jgi:hypothetical protein